MLKLGCLKKKGIRGAEMPEWATAHLRSSVTTEISGFLSRQ